MHDSENNLSAKALNNSEFIFRKVWEIASDGMRLTDHEGKIISVNEAYCRIFDRARGQIEGKLFTDVYDNELKEDILKEYTCDFRESNIKSRFEREAKLWNGRKVWLEFSNSLLKLSDDEHLVLSTVKDISERKRHESSLKKYAQQLRGLASRLQVIREEERTMIAREIHDELGQVLTVLKIRFTLLANKLREDQSGLKNTISSACDVIDQTVETVQRISSKLRPGILDNLGLVAALEWQAQEFKRNTGIKCECYLPKEEISLSSEQSTAIFRIFQEALTNIARHSEADVVMISLYKDSRSLTLSVSDNGCGITRKQISDPKSLGLLGMKERALLLSGEVEIFGKEDRGTTVRVIVPVEENNEREQ